MISKSCLLIFVVPLTIQVFRECGVPLVDLDILQFGCSNRSTKVGTWWLHFQRLCTVYNFRLFRSSKPHFFRRRLFLTFFFPSSSPLSAFAPFPAFCFRQRGAAAFKLAEYDPPCFLWYAFTNAIQLDAPIEYLLIRDIQKNGVVGVCETVPER